MQALSVWPSKGGSCLVSQVDSEHGCSWFLSTRRRRRRKWGLVDTNFNCRRSSVFIVSSYNQVFAASCSCFWSSNLEIKCGFHFNYESELRFHVFSEPKKRSLDSWVAFTWATDREEVRGEFQGVESISDRMLLGESESEDVDCHGLDRIGGGDDTSNNEDNRDVGVGRGKEDKDENSPRIDVRELAKSLDFAKTVEDVEMVLKDKGELPPRVFSSMIRGFGWDKKMTPAFALVQWLKWKRETGTHDGPNLFIYNSLLSAVKQSEQYSETERILNDMAEEGIEPNVVTYNTLMVIYVEQGQATKALDLLNEMDKKGIAPSAASYSTALLAYRKLEDGNAALKFFEETREKYKKGDFENTYDEDWDKELFKLENFTVRVCFQVMRRWLVRKENLSTNVLRLFTDMDRAGLVPDRADYERLLWACTREDHFNVAKELYNRIRESYPDISLSVCNHVIWLMGKAKKWWAALEIYEDLLDHGPRPNNLSYELIVSHFNVLLSAARKRGIWRWGVRLLNKMEEKGLKPGSKEWNAVLVACSKASETNAAVQIFRRMVDRGEKPTIVSYGALLSALEKGRLYDEAVRVWEHMLKVGVTPNLYAYTIMASVYTGLEKFRLVDAIINEMVSSGIEPTAVTYNAIISGCAQNGKSSAAYEWFHRMKVKNISPNKITYEMMILALAKDGKPRVAYELYLRAQNEGFQLSTKAYDAILSSSQYYGATIDSSMLGPRPQERKQRVQIRKNLTEFSKLADVPRRSKLFDRTKLFTTQIENNQQ